MSVVVVAVGRAWWVNDSNVFEGDMNAPYSGNPDRITSTNRRAVNRSSVMNKKSSIYLNNRYTPLQSTATSLDGMTRKEKGETGYLPILVDGRMGGIELLAKRRISNRGSKIFWILVEYLLSAYTAWTRSTPGVSMPPCLRMKGRGEGKCSPARHSL